jgi:hypothetical protein
MHNRCREPASDDLHPFPPGHAPTTITKKAMHKCAIQYLQSMGLLGMDTKEAIDFVISEATGKYTRHFEGCRFLVPAYNQIEIAGNTMIQTDHIGHKTSSP